MYWVVMLLMVLVIQFRGDVEPGSLLIVTVSIATAALLIGAITYTIPEMSNLRRYKESFDRFLSYSKNRRTTMGKTQITKVDSVCFEHVCFAYPGEEHPVLTDVSFTVAAGEHLVIVGYNGSGKSTILNLIAKYYEVSGGTISIGGRPINHVAAERVLDQISMVDQDVFLFNDTVRENIRYARPDATDAEIEAACREANCDGFIRKMEKGYDMPIGENGNLLSGGERQRLSIARAILKNSPILLLDEATASLDIENELAVKQAIANLLKEKKTVVMVAHTLSIVKNADQILVVSDGRITEAGTHKELLKKNGKYAAMWDAEQKNVS